MNDLPILSANQSVRKSASQATMVEQSRAVAEVQAAVVVAQNHPRDVQTCIREMREVCGIQTLAEKAFFRFNRGGGQVNGASIHLARELARIWGNITSGIAELSRDDIHGQSEMIAFSWDLQTNSRQQNTFIVPHVRDTRGGAKPLIDMRDIYENNANMGARRLREMIFAVLPVWFREEAEELCRQTLVHGGGKPLTQRISDALEAFQSIGVTRQQVETKLGRLAALFTAEDVATLGVVFKSIKRGEATLAEEFPRETVEPTKGASKLDAIETQIAEESPPPEDPDMTRALAIASQIETAATRKELDAVKKQGDNEAWLKAIAPERRDIVKLLEAEYVKAAERLGTA